MACLTSTYLIQLCEIAYHQWIIFLVWPNQYILTLERTTNTVSFIYQYFLPWVSFYLPGCLRLAVKTKTSSWWLFILHIYVLSYYNVCMFGKVLSIWNYRTILNTSLGVSVCIFICLNLSIRMIDLTLTLLTAISSNFKIVSSQWFISA